MYKAIQTNIGSSNNLCTLTSVFPLCNAQPSPSTLYAFCTRNLSKLYATCRIENISTIRPYYYYITLLTAAGTCINIIARRLCLEPPSPLFLVSCHFGMLAVTLYPTYLLMSINWNTYQNLWTVGLPLGAMGRVHIWELPRSEEGKLYILAVLIMSPAFSLKQHVFLAPTSTSKVCL